jgi:hypothetical protein
MRSVRVFGITALMSTFLLSACDVQRPATQPMGSMTKSSPNVRIVPLDEGRLFALIDYFGRNMIAVEHVEGGEWYLSEPADYGEGVYVQFAAFPLSASADGMKETVMTTDSALRLNASAHLAISIPRPRAVAEGHRASSDAETPLAQKVTHLFAEYHPPCVSVKTDEMSRGVSYSRHQFIIASISEFS